MLMCESIEYEMGSESTAGSYGRETSDMRTFTVLSIDANSEIGQLWPTLRNTEQSACAIVCPSLYCILKIEPLLFF